MAKLNPPRNLSATRASKLGDGTGDVTKFFLFWNIPEDNGYPLARPSYQIQQRDSTDGTTWLAWYDATTVSTNAAYVSENQTNTHWRMWRVRSIDTNGYGWTPSDYVYTSAFQTSVSPPTFDLVVSPIKLNSTLSDGIYLQGMVKIRAQITNASAAVQKTLDKCTISVAGYGEKTINISTTATYDTDTITTYGSIKITATLIDS